MRRTWGLVAMHGNAGLDGEDVVLLQQVRVLFIQVFFLGVTSFFLKWRLAFNVQKADGFGVFHSLRADVITTGSQLILPFLT